MEYLPRLYCSWCSNSDLVAKIKENVPSIENCSVFLHKKSIVQIVLLILVIHLLNKYFKLLIEVRYSVTYCLCLQGSKDE